MKILKDLPAIVALAFLLIISSCSPSTGSGHFDKSYVHVVYFWLNNPDSAEDRGAFEKSLQTFLDNSKYAQTNFIGVPPDAKRDVVDGSFTYNLIVTFESAAAQENYQNEDAHLKFIEESENLWSKVIVYDALPAN